MPKPTRLGKDGAPLTWTGEMPSFALRIRRGKLVEIPPAWIGKTPTAKTIRQRPSKMIGKLKRRLKSNVAFKDARDMPIPDE